MGLKFERGYLLTKSVHIQVGRVLCFSDNSRARCPGIVYGFLEEYSPLHLRVEFYLIFMELTANIIVVDCEFFRSRL